MQFVTLFKGLMEDHPSKIAIVGVGLTVMAFFSLLKMRSYYSKVYPLEQELIEAIRNDQQPSKLYAFLMQLRGGEHPQQFVDLKENLMDFKTVDACVHRILQSCCLENTPVNFNRCFKSVQRIREY